MPDTNRGRPSAKTHGLLYPSYHVTIVVLILLLVASIAAAQFDLGEWNIFVAIGISTFKTALIMLVFMHLNDASPLSRLIALSGLMWLGVLLILTFGDYRTRAWPDSTLEASVTEQARVSDQIP